VHQGVDGEYDADNQNGNKQDQKIEQLITESIETDVANPLFKKLSPVIIGDAAFTGFRSLFELSVI